MTTIFLGPSSTGPSTTGPKISSDDDFSARITQGMFCVHIQCFQLREWKLWEFCNSYLVYYNFWNVYDESLKFRILAH